MTSLASALALVLAAGIQSTPSQDLIDFQQVRIGEFKKVQSIRDQILSANPKTDQSSFQASLFSNAEIRDMGLTMQNMDTINEALSYRFDLGTVEGYKPIDFKSNDPVLSYAVPRFLAPNKAPKIMTLKDAFQGQQLLLTKVKVTLTPEAEPGKPAPAPETFFRYIGPYTKEDTPRQLKASQDSLKGKATVEVVEGGQIPATIYDNERGQIAVVLDHAPDNIISFDPQFPAFRDPVDKVQGAIDDPRHQYQPSAVIALLAVKEGDKIVDFEHLRRQQYPAVQALSNELKAKHPGSADFPAELAQAPQLKQWGVVLPNDQLYLLRALTFQPEGTPLRGFHPIDWDKDKAAQYVTMKIGANNQPVPITLKDAYQGKQVEIVKLKLVMPATADLSKPVQNDVTKIMYVGPITPDYVDAVKKQAPTKATVEEIKGSDIPLDVYTNDSGAVAFVMHNVPSQPLLLPSSPGAMIPFFTDPLEKIRQMMAKQTQDQQPHPLTDLTFAVRAPVTLLVRAARRTSA